jgi:hypothetical protein
MGGTDDTLDVYRLRSPLFPQNHRDAETPHTRRRGDRSGLAISGGVAIAQKMDKGSAGHIKAVTSAVDANFIKANTPTSKDWPTVGLDYAETPITPRPAKNSGRRRQGPARSPRHRPT